MRFHGTSWQKVPEAPSWLDLPIKMLNADEGTREAEQILLNDTCPQFVRGLLEAGKGDAAEVWGAGTQLVKGLACTPEDLRSTPSGHLKRWERRARTVLGARASQSSQISGSLFLFYT